MANKLLTTDLYSRDHITAEEIAEYVDLIFDTACKMKFRNEDARTNIEILKMGGIKIRYVNPGIRFDKITLGSAYCLPTDPDFGLLELPNNYINMCCSPELVKELTNTLIHEVAHFIAGAKHAHDTIWRSIAERIGKQLAKEEKYFGKEYFTSSDWHSISMGETVSAYIDCYGDIIFSSVDYPKQKFMQWREEKEETVLGYYRAQTPAEYVKYYNTTVDHIIDYLEFN